MQLTFDDNLEQYLITLHHTTLTGLAAEKFLKESQNE